MGANFMHQAGGHEQPECQYQCLHHLQPLCISCEVVVTALRRLVLFWGTSCNKDVLELDCTKHNIKEIFHNLDNNLSKVGMLTLTFELRQAEQGQIRFFLSLAFWVLAIYFYRGCRSYAKGDLNSMLRWSLPVRGEKKAKDGSKCPMYEHIMSIIIYIYIYKSRCTNTSPPTPVECNPPNPAMEDRRVYHDKYRRVYASRLSNIYLRAL